MWMGTSGLYDWRFVSGSEQLKQDPHGNKPRVCNIFPCKTSLCYLPSRAERELCMLLKGLLKNTFELHVGRHRISITLENAADLLRTMGYSFPLQHCQRARRLVGYEKPPTSKI